MAQWNRVPLIDYIELIGGGTPKTTVHEYWNGNIPWLSVKDFNNDKRYVYSTEKHISQSGFENSPTKMLHKDDIIISARGTVGEIAMIPFDMAFNQSCYGIRASRGIDKPFLYYLLKNCISQLKRMTHGSVFDTITRDTFANIEVDIPDAETQKRISSVLADIDNKIEVNDAINDNLLAQAQALFTQRFITDDIEGNEKPLYDFADYINGAAFKPSECGEHGLPIIKIVELKNGITDSTKYFDGFKGEKYLIQDKDILFSWSGNPDTSIDIFIWTHGRAILNQHTFNVKSNTGHRWFTFLMLKHFKPEFSRIASNKQTTGLGHVTANDLKRLTFIFNETAIETFEQEISPFMETIYSNMIENQRLELLRDSLLPKLMSGEIDVSDVQL